MKFIAYLAGGSVMTAVVLSTVSAFADLGAGREIWFGMLGPTLASVVGRVAIDRQKNLNPQIILKSIIQSFVVKSVFFGVYIAALVKTNQVSPGPFVGCFAFFYLALHIAEAVKLRTVQNRLAANDINRQY